MINAAVEGESDVEIAKAVIRATGHEVGSVRAARGKDRLDLLIPKYSRAARQGVTPWVVFRDSDARCPVELRHELLGGDSLVHGRFTLRVAHTMSEAWLLADTAGFASYFSVSRGKMSSDPEAFPHAKRALLDLCAKSRSRAIKEEVVGLGRRPGPLYVWHLNQFASTAWDPEVAMEMSPSLRRAVEQIRRMPAREG